MPQGKRRKPDRLNWFPNEPPRRPRSLHPDQDVFEDKPQATPLPEAVDHSQDTHGAIQTGSYELYHQPPHGPAGPHNTGRYSTNADEEEPDWNRDSQDEASEADGEIAAEEPVATRGTERPAEPTGPPPRSGPRRRLTEEARVARNRRDRAEWRERRRLRRQQGLERGYFYYNGVGEQARDQRRHGH